MGKVLEVKDLVTTFRIGKKEYEVLRGISFDINENETVCMVGESGCGKSVTTLSIMDLLPNNGRVVSGSIKLGGQELTTLSPKERNALRGKQMGMIFQEPMTALNPLLTIGRQLTEGLRLHKGLSKEEAYQVAVTYLEKVGIANPEDRMKQYPFQLSGGMRQRCALIRTLAMDPKILLLDEPFSALDYQTRLAVTDDVHRILKSEGVTALMVTHDIPESISMGDRVMILSARPACIREILPVDFGAPLAPLERRSHPAFGPYFDRIWKELK